ncbi:MAG TPA: hypothetical protein VFF73_29945 [Planctomycetota bacterium]|nr:hypothetical protein [Planctomycetota bacterium]
MSSAVRERLGAAQAELMRALSDLGPAPEGFDPAGVAEEARTLSMKRRRFLAKVRPALARAMGRSFGRHFEDYARTHPFPGHACADGGLFARWFDERLGEPDVLEQLDWSVGLKAVLEPGAKDARADVEQLEALLAAAVKRCGPDALEQPGLKAALVLGSLRAYGLELGRPMLVRLRRELLEAIPAPEESPVTLLDAALRTLRVNLAVERVLARLLDRDERELYLARVGDDPFQGARLPRLRLPALSADGLAAALATVWTGVFGLAASSRPAADAAARDYARRVLELPAPPSDAAFRREAAIERAVALLAIQRDAEEALASSSLGEDERARVSAGRGGILLEPMA